MPARIPEDMQAIARQARALCEGHGARLLYLAIAGSKLYGTDVPGKSDTDVRGLFLPSREDLLCGKMVQSLSLPKTPETDISLWSLQYWLFGLLARGDTNAADLLFSPSHAACVLFKDPRMDRFFRESSALLDANGAKAFAGYALAQARKYGVKGDHMRVIQNVLDFLEGKEGRLLKYIPKIVTMIGDEPRCRAVEANNEPALFLCGKTHMGGISVQEAVGRLNRAMKDFGGRARKAMESGGMDWKALSHAIRALQELEELYDEGYVTFPLRNAEYLKRVKEGEIPAAEVEIVIERRLNELRNAEEAGKDLGRFDEALARRLVVEAYDDPEGADAFLDACAGAIAKLLRKEQTPEVCQAEGALVEMCRKRLARGRNGTSSEADLEMVDYYAGTS